MKLALIILVVLVVFLLIRFWMMGRASQDMNPNLGVRDGAFVACPSSPNCVSSDARDEQHQIPVWELSGDFSASADILSSMPGVTVITREADYIRAEFKSTLFGFVDDVELSLRGEGSQLAMRSASRVGYSDLGANRKRVTAISEALREAGIIR